MRESDLESLSAFADGELNESDSARLAGLAAAEGELRERWARYQLVKTALRGESAGVPRDFLERVGAQLQSEPAILAPRRGPALAKPLAGLAIAATVAAVAVLSVGRPVGQPPQGAPGLALSTSQAPPTLPTGPVVQASARELPPSATSAQMINGYIVNFSESRARTGLSGGVSPYVRIVGFENPAPAR